MKKLLQNRETGEFLMLEGTWTRDLQQAIEVKNEVEALGLARRFQITDEVDVYYSFWQEAHSIRWDFSIPITGDASPPASQIPSVTPGQPDGCRGPTTDGLRFFDDKG